MDDSCAVCADSLEWVAYGACGHKDVCSTCVARLCFICDDLNCCICKTKSDAVFVTKLSPTCVSSLLGINIEGVAAGLWHTICISADGDVYAFGGNQFGQLGTRTDQAETLLRLLDALLENVNAIIVSCGARHSAVITGDGKAFCWGWNKYGQLGLGDVIDRNTPTQVSVDGCVACNTACGW